MIKSIYFIFYSTMILGSGSSTTLPYETAVKISSKYSTPTAVSTSLSTAGLPYETAVKAWLNYTTIT